VQVSWDHALGPVTAEPYRYLHAELAGWDGVDDVSVLRYSAEVTVAPQVRPVAEVVEDLLEWLQTDQDWLGWMSWSGADEYSVNWLE
jgi:hypothetical protein